MMPNTPQEPQSTSIFEPTAAKCGATRTGKLWKFVINLCNDMLIIQTGSLGESFIYIYINKYIRGEDGMESTSTRRSRVHFYDDLKC